jgi:small subunit ribosomal protein S21
MQRTIFDEVKNTGKSVVLPLRASLVRLRRIALSADLNLQSCGGMLDGGFYVVACSSKDTERIIFFMLKVKSRAGESVQQMIRRFKKLCEKEGLIRDMKRMAYYEKPSEKNRRRMRKAQRNVIR